MTDQQPREKMGCLKKLLLGVSLAGAVVVLAVVLGYLLWFLPAANEKTVLETDYLAQWQGPEVAGDEGEHAWPVMVRAVEELGLRPKYERGPGPMRGAAVVEVEASQRLGDEQWDQLAEYLQRPEVNAGLDRLREVSGRLVLGYAHSDDRDEALMAAQMAIEPGFTGWETNPSESPSMQALHLPYLSVARGQAAAMVARAYLRGFEGEAGTESVRDIEAAVALGRHIERQRGGIMSRVGIEIAGDAADTVLEALARDTGMIDPATLKAMDAVMAAWQARQRVSPFEYAVLSDRDMLQRVYNADGGMTAFGAVALAEDELEIFSETSMLSRVDEGLSGQPFWIKAYGVFGRVMFPPRGEIEALIDRAELLGREFGEMEPWEADPAADPVKGLYTVARAMEAYERIPLQVAYTHQIASKMSGAGCVAVSRVSAVRLASAAIRHRNETGDWPGSSDELGDGSAWPDGFTGEPLGMIMGDAGPMIYSAGTDRNDDLGRACEEPMQFRWPDQAAKMEQSKPENYDGDWMLWSVGLAERRTAERAAAARDD